MTAIVLDASALLVLLHKEMGWQLVAERLGGAMISAVNLTEVMDELAAKGMSADIAKDALELLRLDIRDFTRSQAEVASALLPHTKSFKLSLADRVCLSLAKMESAVVLTCDLSWKLVQDAVGVEVLLIR